MEVIGCHNTAVNGKGFIMRDIWNIFHQQLLGFIQRKVGNLHNAEDILQEVFIKVHQNIDSINDTEKLQAWLYQICRRTIIDFYRREKPEASTEDIMALVAEPEKADGQKALNFCVSTLIADLPEGVSEILMDSELEQYKQQSIADKYDLSLSAVKSRIRRGREQLKNKLQACCDFEFKEQGVDMECQNQCGCDKK